MFEGIPALVTLSALLSWLSITGWCALALYEDAA
jgi:hypothetical protein